MEDELKKYGKLLWVDNTYSVPTIMVSDTDLIKEIWVKHFDCFTNRVYFGVQDEHTSLIDARDEKWGVVRKALSPVFTGGKLKGKFAQLI